jgi:hypothetical protein
MPMVAVNSAYIIFTDLRTNSPLYWKSLSGNNNNLQITQPTEENPNPCSLYYSIGKKDDTGFTPETMEWDLASSTLSIVGKQSGTSGDVRRLYRMGSISPRYATLFTDSARTNYARMRIGEIIVDIEVEQPNIIRFFERQQPVGLTTTAIPSLSDDDDEEAD